MLPTVSQEDVPEEYDQAADLEALEDTEGVDDDEEQDLHQNEVDFGGYAASNTVLHHHYHKFSITIVLLVLAEMRTQHLPDLMLCLFGALAPSDVSGEPVRSLVVMMTRL